MILSQDNASKKIGHSLHLTSLIVGVHYFSKRYSQDFQKYRHEFHLQIQATWNSDILAPLRSRLRSSPNLRIFTSPRFVKFAYSVRCSWMKLELRCSTDHLQECIAVLPEECFAIFKSRFYWHEVLYGNSELISGSKQMVKLPQGVNLLQQEHVQLQKGKPTDVI